MMAGNVCDLRHTLQFLPGASITSSRNRLVAAYGGLHVSNTINGFTGNGATSVGTSRTPSQPGTTAAPAQPNSADEVRITDTAAQLASLGEKVRALPAIDAARVERISQALANGTYSISADKIASGLLQSEHALARIGS
jgi:negative regulator of flagellin synthesis FlgM